MYASPPSRSTTVVLAAAVRLVSRHFVIVENLGGPESAVNLVVPLGFSIPAPGSIKLTPADDADRHPTPRLQGVGDPSFPWRIPVRCLVLTADICDLVVGVGLVRENPNAGSPRKIVV